MKYWQIPTLLITALAALYLWGQKFYTGSPEAQLNRFLNRHDISGAVISFRQANGYTTTHIFGKSRLSGETALGSSTSFPIASLSKPITASAVRRLAAQSDLDLEAGLTEVVRTFPEPADVRFREITIRHLLSHTSGLPDSVDDVIFEDGIPVGCDRAIRIALESQLISSPGQRQSYSNTGYCLLERAIEHATGLEYDAAVIRLLHPYTASLSLGPPNRLHEGDHLSDVNRTLGAAGGWYSDAPSLAALYAQDAQDPTVLGDLQTQGDYYYGLGWRVWPQSDGGYYLTHFGSLPGAFSVALAFPDGRSAVALFNGRPTNDEASFRVVLDILMKQMKPDHQLSPRA